MQPKHWEARTPGKPGCWIPGQARDDGEGGGGWSEPPKSDKAEGESSRLTAMRRQDWPRSQPVRLKENSVSWR